MRGEEIRKKVVENVGKVIVGKDEIITLLLTAILSDGHVLLEDVPGTGKTKVAKSLAKSLAVDFGRIQFTPDLLPTDITGLKIYDQKEGEFILRKGPAFTNILLADEINRATPRTQAGLLECMEERQITIDGESHKAGEPFFVIATQNPIETAGTFPLPEAQMDRFVMKLSMGLPSKEEECQILARYLNAEPLKTLEPVLTVEDLKKLSNEDLREALSERLIIEEDRNEWEVSECLINFKGAKKIYYIVNYFDMEVQNGGLCQFFVNSSRDVAPYIIECLKIIGADSYKNLLISSRLSLTRSNNLYMSSASCISGM